MKVNMDISNWAKIGTAILALNIVSAQAFDPSATLVIDEGVDLGHTLLSSKKGINSVEANGQAGIDDDGNGFVDDVSGWNVVSNDAAYLPPGVLRFFQENLADFQKMFDLNSRAQLGDVHAMLYIETRPALKQNIQTLSGLSHGTHVAGIVAAHNAENSKIYSMNVFTPSTAELSKPGSKRLVPVLSEKAILISYADALKPLVSSDREKVELRPEIQPSFLDSEERIKALVDSTKLSNLIQGSVMENYLKSVGVGVANISLETNEYLMLKNFDMLWYQELIGRGLPVTLRRTIEQQARLLKMTSDIFESSEKMWSDLFKSSPNTLFVAAAGNGGEEPVTNAGNNEVIRTTPSNLSLTHMNVISVAATDEKGQLAGFSNFGAKVVNIGAPGIAIDSTIVGGLKGRMTGTSMAAPLVAGVASKMRFVNPDLKPEELRAIIEITGQKQPSLAGKVSSGSAINIEAALTKAADSKASPDLPSLTGPNALAQESMGEENSYAVSSVY